MKSASEKFVLITWGLVFLFGGLLALLKPLGLSVSDTATIEEFYVAKSRGELTQASFEKVDQIPQLEVANSVLYICGRLITDGRPARLLILIRDERVRLIYDTHKEYAPGHFCEKLPDNLLTRAGHYTIAVFKARDKIAQVNLEVTD